MYGAACGAVFHWGAMHAGGARAADPVGRRRCPGYDWQPCHSLRRIACMAWLTWFHGNRAGRRFKGARVE
ncbi:hypothetical protein BCEP27_10441 [Burkholderia cepacia]